MKTTNKPNLLVHIGYHKTGTTWLRKTVFSNADLGFNLIAKKPVRSFLINESSAENITDINIQKARRLIQEPTPVPAQVISFPGLSGRFHTDGQDAFQIADRVAYLYPDASILIVVREQMDMIRSSYSTFVCKGGARSLAEYLKWGRPSSNDRQNASTPTDRFAYFALTNHYVQRFGRSNVLVLPYERLKKAPADFIYQIIHHCGLDIPISQIAPLLQTSRVNVSPALFLLGFWWRANHWLVGPGPVKSESGVVARMEWSKLRRIFQKIEWMIPPSLRIRLNQRAAARYRGDIKAFVSGRYAEDNKQLAQLTGLDLGGFDYE